MMAPDAQNKLKTVLLWGGGGCLAAVICSACVVVLAAASLFAIGPVAQATATRPLSAAHSPAATTPPTNTATSIATETPRPLTPQSDTAPPPTATPEPRLLDPPEAISQVPVPPQAPHQLESLLLEDYPVHDFYEAAQRLSSFAVGERTITRPPFALGDSQTFFTGDSQTEAVLMAITEHTYFWVDPALGLSQPAVAAAARRFEDEYYPRLVNLFGQEWRPGMDNDPHFSVLHLEDMDTTSDELGHFNSGDEYPRALYSASNQQEIIYLNMGNLEVGSELYFGTLVHEYQHLAQWYVDSNETTWLNEGLSQLGEIYLGLETADADDYLRDPATRLTSWNYEDETVFAHYAGAYLFTVYLWEQLGEAAVQELARHPADGIAAVDAILKGYRPETSLEQFMADWAVANYLDSGVAGPQYNYDVLDLRAPAIATTVKFAPFESLEELPQFGVHYVEMDLSGETTVSFAGDTVTALIPVSPYSGEHMWFAPAQENVNAHLTRRFDLTGLDSATLTFWTWYDLKFDLDYAYLTVSRDEGQTWELLDPQGGRPGEYGPAFNGRSSDTPGADKNGWIQERISLNSYVGQPILIRFELLTYFDSLAPGIALDDIAIPELGYVEDVEGEEGGWTPAGFVRTGNLLPQRWALQYITGGGVPEVIPLALDGLNHGQWKLEGGGTLVVMALTPFSDEPADYWLFVTQ